ncbi:MAG: hypothetical protein DI566_09485 [Microbacterium sp.]|nr:MAG: hypothetical protein DI566_09485 [Microbacterium sp.]
MSHHLLFVCAANVCRSPLMELAFASLVAGAGEDDAWTLSSRGVSVVQAHRMCAIAAGLTEGTAAHASVADHVSTQLTDVDVKAGDLVIAASRDERAAIARMVPASRTYTFTLKEAVSLGALAFDPQERERVAANTADGLTLSAYAELLHQRRGRVAVAPRGRANAPRLPWASSDDPQDIPDVHHGSVRRHQKTLRSVRDLVGTLHEQTTRFLLAGG